MFAFTLEVTAATWLPIEVEAVFKVELSDETWLFVLLLTLVVPCAIWTPTDVDAAVRFVSVASEPVSSVASDKRRVA